MGTGLVAPPRQDVLKALGSFVLRSESDETDTNNLESFVQLIDFSALATPNTQVVYGRHGTGKTHLFKAFHQYCINEFATTRAFPIYIDFRDLDLGNPAAELTVAALLLRFYERFMWKVIGQVTQFVEKTVTPSRLEAIFGRVAASKRSGDIAKSVRRLEALVDVHIQDHLSEYSKTLVYDEQDLTKDQGSIGVSAAASGASAKVGVDLSLKSSAEETVKRNTTVKTIFKGLQVVNYAAIRSEIEKIIALSGARAIIVLIDEWSSVRKPIQPLVAEMIRHTLAESDKIFLKIAAREYSTKLFQDVGSGEPIGFDPGTTISVLADLDLALNYDVDNEAVKDFLTTVAWKHACVQIKALKKLGVKSFEDFLCTQLFEDHDSYFEVVRASEGNPRDFLGVLGYCCNALKPKPDQRIRRKEAIKAAAEYYFSNKARRLVDDPLSPPSRLFKKLFEKAVSVKSKLFLISADRARSDQRIQYLWNYRFLHILSPSHEAPDQQGVPHEYIVYSMDYGKLLSYKIHAAGAPIVEYMLEGMRIAVRSALPLPVSRETVRWWAEKSGASAALSRIAGTFIVAQTGVEPANENHSHLVENCIFDDVL